MLKTNRTTYRTLHVGPLAAFCLLMLTACSSDTVQPDNGTDQQGKTPIELTVGIMGEGSAATRTVVTNDDLYGQKAKAFEAGTSLYMVMKSEEKVASTPAVGAKYTSTMGTTEAAVTTASNVNPVKFTDNYIRYWEDAHSRNSLLSIYAACVPSCSDAITIGSESSYNSNTWSSPEPYTEISWPLGNASVANQNTGDFIKKQDLCFSNNISNLVGNDPADNRIGFLETKKFDSKTMYFYHALTKITFKISKGDGFAAGDAFAFSNTNENIVLKGFNTGGTFDIVKGEFTASTVKADTEIKELANTKATGASEAHVLSALLAPGTDLSDATVKDAIHFTLEHNEYKLTKKALMDAIGDKKLPHTESLVAEKQLLALTGDHKMRAGVHYIFTLTVGKTGISNLTAAVVPWEEVTASVTPSNARITLSLLDKGERQKGSFDLYRKAVESSTIDDDFLNFKDWTSGYTANDNKLTLTENNTGVYTTSWYWPNSKTFYHLRAVMPTNTTVSADATNGDYITLTGASTFTDVCWGAPFRAKDKENLGIPANTDGKLTYSLTTGFDNKGTNDTEEDHQISKAIGTTTSTINLEMFHMMSDVTIEIKTTSGADAVMLKDETDSSNPKYTTLSLTNIHPTGTVRMGDGLVTPTGTVTTVNSGNITTYDEANKKYTWCYGFVPQPLYGSDNNATTDDVMLTITTPDNNQYIIDMKDVVASTVGNNLIADPYGSSKKINYWYPNFKYTYTFTLKKTGISVSATLADWENVTAGDDNVQIE